MIVFTKYTAPAKSYVSSHITSRLICDECGHETYISKYGRIPNEASVRGVPCECGYCFKFYPKEYFAEGLKKFLEDQKARDQRVKEQAERVSKYEKFIMKLEKDELDKLGIETI